MGERATIRVDGITIYTHWEGDHVKEIIKEAYVASLDCDGGDALSSAFPGNILKVAEDGDTECEHEIWISLENDVAAELENIVHIDMKNRTVDRLTFDNFLTCGEFNDESEGVPIIVKITQQDGSVLYMDPIDGLDLENAYVHIRAALGHHVRWDDDAYLTRIIYDALSGRPFEETGYGISAGLGYHEDRHYEIADGKVVWSDYSEHGTINLEDVPGNW